MLIRRLAGSPAESDYVCHGGDGVDGRCCQTHMPRPSAQTRGSDQRCVGSSSVPEGPKWVGTRTPPSQMLPRPRATLQQEREPRPATDRLSFGAHTAGRAGRRSAAGRPFHTSMARERVPASQPAWRASACLPAARGRMRVWRFAADALSKGLRGQPPDSPAGRAPLRTFFTACAHAQVATAGEGVLPPLEGDRLVPK
jgi:hypothetical protein